MIIFHHVGIAIYTKPPIKLMLLFIFLKIPPIKMVMNGGWFMIAIPTLCFKLPEGRFWPIYLWWNLQVEFRAGPNRRRTPWPHRRGMPCPYGCDWSSGKATEVCVFFEWSLICSWFFWSYFFMLLLVLFFHDSSGFLGGSGKQNIIWWVSRVYYWYLTWTCKMGSKKSG